MSQFANPAAVAADAAARYTRDLLAVLGDQDPLEVQAGQVARLRQLFDGVPPAAAGVPEGPGKWSMLQVLEHLVDSEIVQGYRLRSMVAEDAPPIRGYDQDRWAQQLGYGGASVATLLAELAVLRERNLRLLRGLGPAEWDRVGIHSERGPESVRRLTALLAAHDLVHGRQLARIRAAVGGADPAGGA